ncbi:WD40-repeat-containing domain protein [Aspergillus aurantiobrunneus]
MDELAQEIAMSSSRGGSPILAYFLCQGSDSRLNEAASVLRGLMYLLAVQRPSLLRHLRSKYDHAGRRLFEGPDQFYSLMGPFLDMIRDPAAPGIYLAVNAVDDCETGFPQLLDLIAKSASMTTKIKWIVSSRNGDDVAQRLGTSNDLHCLRLELNPGHIADAIDAFIDTRVSGLASLQQGALIRDQVKERVRETCDGTFLGAALVVDGVRKDTLASDTLKMVRPLKPVPLTRTYTFGTQRQTPGNRASWATPSQFLVHGSRPNNRHLVSISRRHPATVWDTVTGACRKTIDSKTCNVVFPPNSLVFVSVMDNGTMQLWEAVSMKRMRVLRGHKDGIRSVDISANGQIRASASDDSTVRVWDAATGACRYAVKGRGKVRAIACAPDGQTLVAATQDEKVHFWDTGIKTWTHAIDPDIEPARRLAFSPDGRTIAIASKHDSIAVHDVSSGTCQEAFTACVQDIRFSPGGRSLVTDKGLVQLAMSPQLRKTEPSKGFRAFSVESGWVTFNKQRIIWLPPEYRDMIFAVYRSTFDKRSGRMVFIGLDVDQLSQYC